MPEPDSADSRYAIIELHEHEPPPERAIAHGGGKLVSEFMDASRIRADALDAMAGVAEAKAELADREEQVQLARLDALNAVADNITRRLDAFEARREARAAADAEAEAARVQEMVDSWPDPEEPDEPAHHTPGGELHELAAPTADEPGDLPRQLRRGTPPELGTMPQLDRRRMAHPQPDPPTQAAISLNEQ